MIQILIKDQTFSLPVHIREISIPIGIEIEKLRSTREEEDLEYKKEILSCLMDYPISLLDEVVDEQIEVIYDNLPYLRDDLRVHFSHSFTLRGVDYTRMDLNSMTVTEFTEIDSYLDGDIYENMTKILSILYRPVVKNSYKALFIIRRFISRFMNQLISADHEDQKVIQMIDYDEFKESYLNRAELFERYMNFITAQSMVLSYLDHKSKLLKEFNLLSDEDEDEEEGVRKKARKTVGEIWGLYHTLEILSNGNIIEMEIWMKKPVRQLLTKLAYMKMVQQEEKNK